MSTILLISPESWSDIFVSKHHYALELARRGHRVLFYGPPSTGGGIYFDPVVDAPGDLQVLNAPSVASGLRFMPTRLRRALETNWLRRVEKSLGHPIDVVWNFENSRFFDMGFSGDRLKIYQQVDLNQDFHPETAAASADLSIAISEPIERRLVPFAHHLIRITHGYAAQEVAQSLPEQIEVDFARASANAVLIGNLDIDYLDVPLLAELVKRHPDTYFHFVGTYTPEQGLHGVTAAAPNVRFWGPQPVSMLPAFLTRADILLVAYLAENHLEQLANPHKIMEYLASGRCVLATRTLEYDNRPDLIETALHREDYLQRFTKIIRDPMAWNSDEKIALRQEFARDNTYPRQLDRIAKVIGKRGKLIV